MKRRPCRTAPSPCRSRDSPPSPVTKAGSTRPSRCSERSLGDNPGLGLTNFLVGRAYVELKRFHQAKVHLQRALLWAEADGTQKTPAREPLVAGAEDRAAIVSELARAQAGLGEIDGQGESTARLDRRAQ